MLSVELALTVFRFLCFYRRDTERYEVFLSVLVPYSLFFIPYSLFLIPCSLFLIPYSLLLILRYVLGVPFATGAAVQGSSGQACLG